jgi:hypothetical protein
MNTSSASTLGMAGFRRLASLALLCIAAAFSQGCATSDRTEPQGFTSPEEAVQAFTIAIRTDNTEKLLAIMGSEGEPIISSGDDVADRLNRKKFLTLYDEKHSIVDDEDGKTLVIGKSEWPFPIPLVKEGGKWVFDAESGKEEILNRRIGNNELSAIEVCKAIGDAQKEYALRDPDNDGVHEYAQKFASDEGKHNGLFWRTAEGEKPSPLGELAAEAAEEGYKRKEEGRTPYHGYYYRILTSQGPDAPGGAMDYMSNGHMILGFAVVAWPAEYNNSGIMTFIMGPDGVAYQKDLGEDTARLASEMPAFNPGEGWKKSE